MNKQSPKPFHFHQIATSLLIAILAIFSFASCDKPHSDESPLSPKAKSIPSNIVGNYQSTSYGIKNSGLNIVNEGGVLYITGAWVMEGHFRSNGELPKQQITFLDTQASKAKLTGTFYWNAPDWGGEWRSRSVNFHIIDKDTIRIFAPESASANVVFTRTW